MSKMFDCITKTWNPLGGKCPYQCIYCWARKLAKRYGMKKYEGKPRIVKKEMKRKFEDGDFVFVQDMSDLFADNVPHFCIAEVLHHIKKFPDATFLLLTKNPKRYFDYKLPPNCVAGATIETNRWKDSVVSLAPVPIHRAKWMMELPYKRKMISIEPIMDFDLITLEGWIENIKPEFVYIGYDNYYCELPEPPIEKVDRLIEKLRVFTEVREKPSVEARR